MIMDAPFGGLGLCVAYYQDKCPYAEPYYFCSYHGIETDLLNLTACWGYELWRFSTTCTLVIESVKATSVIFLLGFGSFVCYKLYRYYTRGKGKRSKLLKWASEELLDSLSDIDDSSVHNIQSKYFGPDEITVTTNDEVTSPVSDVESSGSFPLDSPNEQDEEQETSSDLSDLDLSDMGNSNTRYEPVKYNPQQGISFSDLSLGTAGLPPSATSRSGPKFSFLRPKLGHKRRKRSGLFPNLGALISEQIASSQLELVPLRNGAGEALAEDNISLLDWPEDHQRQCSDMEADIESLGSPSIEFYADSESEENTEDLWLNSDKASLNANFSPGSLLGRRHLLDRTPPDGADALRGNNRYDSDDFSNEDISAALKEPLTFQDDNLGLDTDSEDVVTCKNNRGCLTRDCSYDSTGSDVSMELSFRDDIGLSTMANLDHLLAHLDQVKQSCLNMDESIDQLKGHCISSLKSPVSESSDFSANISAKELVRKYKSRATFKGLLDTGVTQITSSESVTSNDSAALPHVSLEWDSNYIPKDNLVFNKNVVNTERTPGDSGSDFGASLTSESPEPNKGQATSPASLEWEEEFVNSLPTSPRKPLHLFTQQMPAVLSTLLSERVVPGQSRECSPGESGPFNTIGSADETKVTNSWGDWTCGESGFVDTQIEYDQPVVKRRNHSPSSGARKANRDSAFCDGLDIGFSRMQENIGEKWELIQYSETEWRGHTTRAETIRKGYAEIPSTLNCFHLRRIRGDNYCALRASLFQVLELGLPLLNPFGGCLSVCQKLEDWAHHKYPWLKEWSFGSRLPYSIDTCILGFKICIRTLDRLINAASQNSINREELLVDQFNSDSDTDVQLMEAVKLLMFIRSAELYEQSMSGADVPIFAVLLFARETSETPKQFMERHLNLVGDSGGLEQVEMYLLGHTLGVTLRIVRPSSFSSEDYICYYPEKEDNNPRPEVNLIAEDDRHYNIIIK